MPTIIGLDFSIHRSSFYLGADAEGFGEAKDLVDKIFHTARYSSLEILRRSPKSLGTERQ